MKISKKLLLVPALVITLAGTAWMGISRVSAATTDSKYPPLVTKFMQKFGLKESDVQSVMDEVQSDRQKEMQARYEARLTEAVTAGEITAAQKQLLWDKHAELKAKMQAQRQELQTWGTQNNIDLK